MRRHGWGGDMPVDDAAAIAKILDAARRQLRENPGSAPSISQVAERLSVTRQTVYRYFPSTHALLVGAVNDSVIQFLDDIADHLRNTTDPAEAVIEGIAYTYEQLAHRSDLSLLIAASSTTPNEITSATASAFGRSMLDRTPVDWAAAGYGDTDLGELVELMLRTLQSFIIDPGSPTRTPTEFRNYLRRWVGRAVTPTLLAR